MQPTASTLRQLHQTTCMRLLGHRDIKRENLPESVEEHEMLSFNPAYEQRAAKNTSEGTYEIVDRTLR